MSAGAPIVVEARGCDILVGWIHWYEADSRGGTHFILITLKSSEFSGFQHLCSAGWISISAYETPTTGVGRGNHSDQLFHTLMRI